MPNRKYLIQILLPLYTPKGRPISLAQLTQVRSELTDVFGGATAYLQSPAAGFWKKSKHHIEKDQVILMEVVIPRIQRTWWERYKSALEKRFHQEEIHIRAWPFQKL